jgi:glycosyltransferase involved in cell wall biosynthesis
VANVSVVIITKNEERNIAHCIQSARLLTGDIVIVDSGSSDATIKLAKEYGAKLISTEWRGYGASKNKGAAEASHDWIFSLDADERITPQLAQSIKKLDFKNPNCIYQFKRANYVGNKQIKFGVDGFDKVIRLYHRHHAEWDLTLVHEKLIGTCFKEKIPGFLVHYSTKTLEDYREKLLYYAKLSAAKYFEQKKKASPVKRFLSPLFNSFKSYVFQLGFLDGITGLKLAKLIFYYTRLKYNYLYQLNAEKSKKREFGGFEAKPINKSTIAFLRK